MKASDSTKATRKLWMDSWRSLPRPLVWMPYSGGVCFLEGVGQRLLVEVGDDRDRALLGVALDLAGAHPGAEGGHVGELDERAAAAGYRHRREHGRVAAEVLLEAEPHVVLLTALAVEAHLLAADHGPERGGDRVHPHAEVRRLLPIDVDLHLGLAERLGGVQVHEARPGLELLDHAGRVLLQPAEVRTAQDEVEGRLPEPSAADEVDLLDAHPQAREDA